MGDRETPQIYKYGENKTTRIMSGTYEISGRLIFVEQSVHASFSCEWRLYLWCI